MNERSRMLLLAALAAGPFLAACSDNHPANTAATRTERSMDKVATATEKATSNAATAVDDTAITAKVKAAVLAEPGLKSLQIDVDTKDGVVTLSGNVANPELKERATQLAQGVNGVRSVRDNLAVKSTG